VTCRSYRNYCRLVFDVSNVRKPQSHELSVFILLITANDTVDFWQIDKLNENLWPVQPALVLSTFKRLLASCEASGQTAFILKVFLLFRPSTEDLRRSGSSIQSRWDLLLMKSNLIMGMEIHIMRLIINVEGLR
jgi:hypothetical protein